MIYCVCNKCKTKLELPQSGWVECPCGIKYALAGKYAIAGSA